MHLSTVFVSSALVLAGMSTALTVDRENTLVARFAVSDFLAPIEARAYGKEPELYARRLSRRSYYVPYGVGLVARGNMPSRQYTLDNDETRNSRGTKRKRLPPIFNIPDKSNPPPDLNRIRNLYGIPSNIPSQLRQTHQVTSTGFDYVRSARPTHQVTSTGFNYVHGAQPSISHLDLSDIRGSHFSPPSERKIL